MLITVTKLKSLTISEDNFKLKNFIKLFNGPVHEWEPTEHRMNLNENERKRDERKKQQCCSSNSDTEDEEEVGKNEVRISGGGGGASKHKTEQEEENMRKVCETRMITAINTGSCDTIERDGGRTGHDKEVRGRRNIL